MNDYLLFAGSNYPDGGMGDYQGEFETVEEAVSKFKELKLDWYHVAIKSEMVTCASGGRFGGNYE